MAKCKLDELCEFITDGTHQTPEYCAEGGIIFLSSKDVTERKINWDDVKYIPNSLHEKLYKRLSPRINDILLAKNGTTGVAAIVDKDEVFDVYVSLAVLRPLDTIYPKYLLYAINSPVAKRQFNAGLKGVGVPNLHLGVIRETVVNVAPRKEQEKICEILDKVAILIDERKTELELLDDLIKARFVEILKVSELSDEITIEAITERVKVGFVGTCEKYYTDDSGIPMLRTGNITEKGINIKDLKYVTPEFHEKNKKSQIHSGDLLIARHGSNGQANVYSGPDAQCLNAVVIVPNRAKARSVFLAGLINSPMVKKQIDKTLVGSTQHVVNTKSIANLVVRIPDLDVQQQYEEFVNQVDKSKFVGIK
ncbi:restriction endonuclease subunit S [Frisingicoccus sp.]|uniref:restriction endonuclease subunit S n=1 Tax=Frisingicoccus sp. TaxID=1918627 RepID=UPI003AB465E0